MWKFVFAFVLFTSVFSITNHQLLEKYIFPPLPVTVLKSDNPQCQKHSDLYLTNLKNFTLWAYEMWDATAKTSFGVLRGNVFQMGHFEQCLTAQSPFPTQYCMATLKANIPKPKQKYDLISLDHDPYVSVLQRLYSTDDVSQQARNIIQVGWCVPASCSVENLEKFLNGYVNELDMPLRKYNVTYGAKFANIVCQTQKERESFTAADYSFCILSAILVFLVLSATLYELKEIEKPLNTLLPEKLLLAFSARKSIQDLKKIDESNPALTILYGMRTLCILMIILDHRFGTFTSSALLNFNYVEKQYRSPIACFLFHGDLFVDSFFLLSGLLVAYGLLNQFDKTIPNPGFIILLRYVRLTPVYAFVIFYYATLFNYSGNGPLWKVIAGQDSQDCKDNWWANLLYISNYVNADHMCMTHSWYLPCDFHYFIIGIAVCLLLKKQKKMGLVALLTLIITSVIIPFILTIIYNRPALLFFYPEFLTGPKSHPDFLLTYSKSHTRATPYFIGMAAGYLYYRLKGANFHICRMRSYSILLGSILLMLVSIVSGAVFYNPYHPYNSIESATYAALHRPAFAIGSAGVLYVASYGHASFIYKILSWNLFVPLSKLVYGAYLIHMQFQLRSAAKFMSPRYISYFDVISLGLSDMVLAFITALVLYVVVEAPFRRIFRELVMPPTKNEKKRESIIIDPRSSDSRL